VATVVAVLLLGAAVPAASAQATAPRRSAPGEVLEHRRIPAPPGARAWQVVYASRDEAGDDIAVSGFVVAPDGPPPAGGRPVVAWAHATAGLGDGCAPSRGPAPVDTVPWILELLDAGYVVAATDYAGLGTDGIHPYLVGGSEGRSVLDSIRAARALPTGANRKAVVYGHSQGGHATLFAGELAARYAPEIALRGVAPGAAVAAPGAFIDHTIDRFGDVGFLVMGALGYQGAYPEIAAMRLLGAASADQVQALNGCAFDIMAAFEDGDPRVVFGTDPGAVEAWQSRVRENAAGLRRSVPVMYWQGETDWLTPIDEADAYVARACRKGTVVDYRVYAGADHVSVLDAAHDDVLDFFASVLGGRQVRSGCGD